jgi:hypothetical protein
VLVFDNAGADGDGHVHISGVAQVATGAAIDTALDGFELVNQFHGMYLGRAGERTRREGGLEHVHIAHMPSKRMPSTLLTMCMTWL